MRFTNRECLEKMQLAMQNCIIPALPVSGTTQVAVATVMHGIDEMLKRETVTPTFLQQLLPEGLALAREQIDLLAALGANDVVDLQARQLQIESTTPDWDHVAALQRKYNDLIAHLEACARLLFDRKSSADNTRKQRISALLKRNAEWEMAFIERQTQPLPPSSLAAPIDSTLESAALEAFIAKQHPASVRLSVDNLERLLGGYGKETWLFDLHIDGTREPLVLRRNNIGPGALDRGSWQIAQEFPLLRLLHREGVLLPEPLWMGHDEPGMGTPFYIARRVAGTAMGTFMKSNQDLSEGLWLQVAEQLAKLHSVPIDRFSAHIAEFYGPELVNCTATQGMLHYLNWWRDYWKDFERLSSPLEIYLFDWLYSHLPDDPRPATLVHSDFGAHNLLADGQRLTAILDWESPLFGSPGMDLAYVRRWISDAMDWQKFVSHYEACGGRHIEPADYAFCDALTYMRTATGTNKSTAIMRHHASTEYKELVLGLLFLPKMMKMAYDNTLAR
jgi:aminoglycoside phosphotransferase (APT) family kinase protein